MKKLDFNNKTFALVENSQEGKVNGDTVFKYKQKGDLVTADYYGGTIRYGKIIARLEGDVLRMLYQCLTLENELKAGKAIAKVSHSNSDKIKLLLDWEWLTDSNQKGISEYIEIDG